MVAIEALAERRDVDTDSAGISLVPMGGAQAIGRFLDLFVPQGLKLAGLCDAAEEGDFARGLERTGLGSNLTRADMEELGFYVCVADLEDELIRALGAEGVERVIDAQGELASLRRFQAMPQHRGTPVHRQLHRFIASKSGRKARYAALMIDALDLSCVPRPLDRVLARV